MDLDTTFWKCICIQNFWISIIHLNLYPAKPRYTTLNISLEKSSRWNVLFECGKAAAIRRYWATSTFSKAKPKFPRRANTNLLCARANSWPNTDRAPKKIKQKYSNDSAYVSWSSKAPSATAGKLLKFVIIMVEKWFDHHFSSFFQGYSLRHKKSALTLAVDQRTWRFFFQIFLRKG